MKKAGIAAAVFGIFCNFGLFLAKLYVSISSSSLAIYCDAVNNFLDIFSCLLALLAFVLIARLSQRQAERTQSLCTFVIDLVIAGTGIYFLYNGLQRTLRPLPIAYTYKYAIIIGATVFAKAIMALIYHLLNKRAESGMIRALVLDSILDCGITLFTLIGLIIVPKVGFAADGIFALILGGIITAHAGKEIVKEAKYLISG